MGEARRKQERRLVSVLIPERGRPEMLDRLICSLIDTAGSDERYEILVRIDDDDPAWVDRTPNEHSHTRYLRRPRPMTLGEKLNAMAEAADGDILWFIANDQVMDTPGWPAKFRDATAKLPNGIGVPYVRDALHPGHASYPLMTRRMYEVLGFFMAPCYPYWFVDTHQDEIGILTGLKFEIDVEVSAPEGRGKTHGLYELAFWVKFFEDIRPIRVKEAILCLAAAYGEGSSQFRAAMTQLDERSKFCAARTAHLSDPAFIAHWEENADSPPSPMYPHVKAHAEQMAAEVSALTPRRLKVAIAVPSGRTFEASMANALAALCAYSAQAGIGVFNLNVQSSSITHGRNATVEIALKENADLIFWIDSDMIFKPDTLIRLLKHGKDIVAATYCKRTKPHTVLGRFVGPKPDILTDGLYEAEALPGGMMLVKTDVYRKIGFPYYAEAYQFPGDGLSAFKGLMKSYFAEEPSEDVLTSLDQTAFGKWVAENYRLGFDGEKFPYFSEDNWFIRRARRAGYRAWCDVALTGEMIHLGVLEVTCALPPDIQKTGVESVTAIHSVGAARQEGGMLFAAD